MGLVPSEFFQRVLKWVFLNKEKVCLFKIVGHLRCGKAVERLLALVLNN